MSNAMVSFSSSSPTQSYLQEHISSHQVMEGMIFISVAKLTHLHSTSSMFVSGWSRQLLSSFDPALVLVLSIMCSRQWECLGFLPQAPEDEDVDQDLGRISRHSRLPASADAQQPTSWFNVNAVVCQQARFYARPSTTSASIR